VHPAPANQQVPSLFFLKTDIMMTWLCGKEISSDKKTCTPIDTSKLREKCFFRLVLQLPLNNMFDMNIIRLTGQNEKDGTGEEC
jgi:hypothetical protein